MNLVSGTSIVCTQELTGRSRNYDPGRVAIESQHDFGKERTMPGLLGPQYKGK